jgi:hypothetical protein
MLWFVLSVIGSLFYWLLFVSGGVDGLYVPEDCMCRLSMGCHW